MRSHILVHCATTKYFSNSFIFKNKIEKEGLPRDSTPDLGAGGPIPFKQRRLGDQHLEWLWFLDSLRGYPLRLHVACVKDLALSDDLSKLVAIRQGNGRVANCKDISEVLKGIS